MEEHCGCFCTRDHINKTKNNKWTKPITSRWFYVLFLLCCVLCCAVRVYTITVTVLNLRYTIRSSSCIVSTYVLFLLLYFIIFSLRCHSFSLNTWARAYRPSCHRLSVCVCAIDVGGEWRVAKRNGINSRAHTKDIFICGNGDMRMDLYNNSNNNNIKIHTVYSLESVE